MKARLAARPEEFAWSSHRHYLGSAPAVARGGEALSLLAGSRPKARRLFQEFVAGIGGRPLRPRGARLGAAVGGEDFVRAALAKAGRADLVRRRPHRGGGRAAVAAREGRDARRAVGPEAPALPLPRRGASARCSGARSAGSPSRGRRASSAATRRRSRATSPQLERRLAEDPDEARRYEELRRRQLAA